jgi:hypothetical protein
MSRIIGRRAPTLAAFLVLVVCSAGGCSPVSDPDGGASESVTPGAPDPSGSETASESTAPEAAATEPTAAAPSPRAGGGERIAPTAIAYRGAFRLPGPSGESNWTWAGDGMAYRPDGDPDGPDDGYPGSLFGFGHDHQHHVSEITIPAPVVSKAKKLSELPTAKALQPFADVRAGHFTDYEIPRADLAYLPPQGEQTRPKLYFCFGQHMHETFKGPTHCWCEVDLASPQTAGPWTVGGLTEYVTTDYLCVIPKPWADAHAGGMRLATGRFRDGGQGSQGPTLFAVAPWQHGNPPEPGTNLKAVTLLRYSVVTDDTEAKKGLKNYHHSDEWAGASWLTDGSRTAVVFVGTKGQGKCWYGFANGVVWPEEGPWPDVPPYPNDQRGWWSERFVRQMLLYDPADLARVAAGTMKPHEPQPYAVVDLDPYLFSIKGEQDLYKAVACAADQERGRLYVFERNADEDDRAIVHVWEIE